MKEDGSVPLTDWLSTLRDLQAKTAIRRRIDRFGAGNPGSSRSLRSGVSELKIDMGPGYRVYYALHGQTIVLLLCGGKGLRPPILRRQLATGKIGRLAIGVDHETCCFCVS
ncbi:type II toxin-antitoxin system RelE/ParE family toxin [Rhodoferax sp.]|uniref:type II toxin-antitoxin system RelE/ParE family toxin n=1 Tax=Rhodoferax sp. TaxID=50421 RepID=UPI003438D9A3